jgi:formylglycine-generating enzyme required for sulfatase activity
MLSRSVALVFILAATLPAAVDFRRDIQPLLEKNCLPCHATSTAAGGVAITTRAALLKRGIVPGAPDRSSLYTVLLLPSNQPKAMPPGGPQLPKEQVALVRDWIAEGAVWPDNVVLGAAKKTAPADDLALVKELHKRIAASAAGSKPESYKLTVPGTDVSFEMVAIPGGEFTMGTPPTEKGRRDDEGPQHKVKIERFWMGKHEVTWDEYRLFMFSKDPQEAAVDAVSRPTRPYVEMSFGMGINGYPAISMTQHAANKYAQWLSAKTGHFYRLPTEAEWEYACRAGTTTAYFFGDDASKLSEYAWFVDNSNSKYEKVGTKKPNPWGLHDILGNVMEWTLDQYVPDFYGKRGSLPWARQTTPYPQVVRGGAWSEPAENCRCGIRVASEPAWKMQDPQLPKSIWYLTDAQWVGFRLVRPLKVPPPEEMHRYWNNGVEVE